MNKPGIPTPTQCADDEDSALVDGARRGERIAFDRLVLKYQDRTVSLCTRLLGSREEGADAAQEAFVKVYRTIATFRGESRFSTWLYRIALNTCRNHAASFWTRLRKRAVEIDAPVESIEGSFGMDIRDTRLLPSKDLERHRVVKTIKEALKKLPLGQRELIVMRDIQDMTYEEIACAQGLELGTVKSRINRAREALRHRLKGLADDR